MVTPPRKKYNLKEYLWISLMLFLATYTALEAPFPIVFKTQVKPWQVVMDLILSFFFFLDFLIRLKEKKLYKTHNDYHKNQTSNKFDNIILNRLSDIFDILCFIPFDALAFVLGQSPFFQALRLVRLIRIFKIYTHIKSIPFIPMALNIQLILLGFFIVINFIACGWVLLYPKPEDISVTSYFIKAIYWAITTVATVGYGDITPPDDMGRIYASCVMIVGVGMYTIIIGNVTRMLAISDRHKDQSREKINDLIMFMDHYNIPKDLRDAAISHYHHILSKRLSENDEQIISDLPHVLQNEMQIYMKIKLISKIPLFYNCRIECLKEEAKNLEQVCFGPMDKIIHIGDIGHEIFIIAHGTVTVTNDKGETIASLHDGQFFGERALLEDTPRTANIISMEYSDLYSLTREKFLPLISRFPELKVNLDALTNRRKS